MELIHLKLAATLPVREGETINQYTIDPAAALSFEADAASLLGSPLAVDAIPGGDYCFAQIRGNLDREGWEELALWVQKEALWQRCRIGTLLYTRTLYEDGSGVSQVFRPKLS